MEFDKNKSLDEAIQEINDLLYPLEKREMQLVEPPQLPNLLLFGNSRIGSTLFIQWMASINSIAYPSNFLSRFYKAPYIGALIYNLLTKPEYQYRNEFEDINSHLSFSSNIGKTKGLKSPHGFWYFWRRFIEELPDEPLSEEEFSQKYDFTSLNKELALLQKVFQKPFLMKGMILNSYMKSLAENIDNAIFIHMHRDPVATIRSLITAREKWYGNREQWFTWKPREYNFLKVMDIYHQVAGQVYFIDKDILNKRKYLGERYFSLKYEDFCKNPEKIYVSLMKKVQVFSPQYIPEPFNDSFKFKISNPVSNEDEKIAAAYAYFETKFGVLEY